VQLTVQHVDDLVLMLVDMTRPAETRHGDTRPDRTSATRRPRRSNDARGLALSEYVVSLSAQRVTTGTE
jgi:hypothetical protein